MAHITYRSFIYTYTIYVTSCCSLSPASSPSPTQITCSWKDRYPSQARRCECMKLCSERVSTLGSVLESFGGFWYWTPRMTSEMTSFILLFLKLWTIPLACEHACPGYSVRPDNLVTATEGWAIAVVSCCRCSPVVSCYCFLLLAFP